VIRATSVVTNGRIGLPPQTDSFSGSHPKADCPRFQRATGLEVSLHPNEVSLTGFKLFFWRNYDTQSGRAILPHHITFEVHDENGVLECPWIGLPEHCGPGF
jgi:hypothetical protein